MIPPFSPILDVWFSWLYPYSSQIGMISPYWSPIVFQVTSPYFRGKKLNRKPSIFLVNMGCSGFNFPNKPNPLNQTSSTICPLSIKLLMQQPPHSHLSSTCCFFGVLPEGSSGIGVLPGKCCTRCMAWRFHRMGWCKWWDVPENDGGFYHNLNIM